MAGCRLINRWQRPTSILFRNCGREHFLQSCFAPQACISRRPLLFSRVGPCAAAQYQFRLWPCHVTCRTVPVAKLDTDQAISRCLLPCRIYGQGVIDQGRTSLSPSFPSSGGPHFFFFPWLVRSFFASPTVLFRPCDAGGEVEGLEFPDQ